MISEKWYYPYKVNKTEEYQVPSIVMRESFAKEYRGKEPVLFPFVEGNKLILSGDVAIEPKYLQIKDNDVPTTLGSLFVPTSIICKDWVLVHKDSNSKVFDVSEIISDVLLVTEATNADYHLLCISNFSKCIFMGVDVDTIGENSALIDFGVCVDFKDTYCKKIGYYSVVSINEKLKNMNDLPEGFEWVKDEEFVNQLHDLSAKYDK